MESDWQVVGQRPVTANPKWDLQPRATALCFDMQQELLWVGDQLGRVQSYLGADHLGMSQELDIYVAYKHHRMSTDQPFLHQDPSIAQLASHRAGIFSLSSAHLVYTARSGVPLWRCDASQSTGTFRCMSTTGNRDHLLLARTDRPIELIDIASQQRISTLAINSDSSPTHIKQAQTTCVAFDDGHFEFLDNSSYEVAQSWKAVNGPISDFDVKGNYVITCGQSLQPYGLNQTVNIYDTRMHRQLAPIPVIAGAAFVKMHPRMSSTAIVVAQNGTMQTVDLSSSIPVNFKHASVGSYIGCMDLSPSGNALVIADSDQSIPSVQLWASPAKNPLRFLEKAEPVMFPDVALPMLIQPSWSPARSISPTPLSVSPQLNAIGLSPYSLEHNLNWVQDFDSIEFGMLPPEKIDDNVMKSAQFHSQVGYAPNPKGNRRNQRQVNSTARTVLTSASQVPRFLSQQARKPHGVDPAALPEPTPEELTSGSEGDLVESMVPTIYREHHIKYSKFGIDDFDFSYYNPTEFSGLEGDITNCYVNPYLQLLKFTPTIRNLSLHHAAGRCFVPLCLLCEAGYVCDNLEKGSHLRSDNLKVKNRTSQATNFLSAFGAYPGADNKQVYESSLMHGHSQTIQRFSDFLLQAFMTDALGDADHVDQARESLMVRTVEEKRCQQCNAGSFNKVQTPTTELAYNSPPVSFQASIHPPRFAEVLQQSLERDVAGRGWCSGQCQAYRPIHSRWIIQQLPDVLTLHISALKALPDFWSIQGWLPDTIGIVLDNGAVHCFQGVDLENVRAAHTRNLFVFRLVGMVAEIKEAETPHLVSLIDTGAQTRAKPDWHLFNDFLVRRCSSIAALSFPAWKRPAILSYQLDRPMLVLDNAWAQKLDTSILRLGLSQSVVQSQLGYAPLTSLEMPRPGMRVSLDAEYVTLHEAKTEKKENGTSEVVRPLKSGVARVSICRAEGVDEGEPFIDDFVLPSAAEPIVDFVTQYSGITAEDLDRKSSTKNLVPLKLAYKRIWTLSNLGCHFIGHGLRNDFRKININVPTKQAFDTQTLLYRENQRFLSLKYLAWECLSVLIQQGEGSTGHSSVEDAAIANLLFRKWEEYEDAGVLEARLQEIYDEGGALGWKPPASEEDGREQLRLRKRRSKEAIETDRKRRSSPEDFAKRWQECTGGRAVLASAAGTGAARE